MELNKVSEKKMIVGFELAVLPEIRGQIKKIKETCGGSWELFARVLKEEYFIEDSERVTKRSFLEWIAQSKSGLSANELLREFDRQSAQLSKSEKLTLEVEKIELFLQAADVSLWEKLKPLLEDKAEEHGLKTAWKDVEEAVFVLTKRQRRRDKVVINREPSSSSIGDLLPKMIPTAKPSEEVDIGELVKGMWELRIKFARLEKKGQPMEVKPLLPDGFTPRYMWCDSQEHVQGACEEFKEALRSNKVFFKEGRIHAREIGQPLKTTLDVVE
ncbi:unnamed protein product [Calypogeia fissa]